LRQIVSIFVLLANRLDALKVVVHGDPGLLRRMIRNLLANAERHGGDVAFTPVEGGGSRFTVTLPIEHE
jgi:signal transduction histidine kinase